MILFKGGVFIKDIYRIKEWWYLLGIPVLGFLYRPHSNYISLLINLVACVPLLAFAHSLNSFFDRNSKRIFLIPLSAFVTTIIFLFFFDMPIYSFTYSILILLVCLYSMPPIALQRIPFVSTMCNAIAPPMLIILGINELDRNIFRLIFIVSSLFLMAQVFHELADLEKDKRDNIITTIQILGNKKFMIIGILFLSLACFLSFKNDKIISFGAGIMLSSAIYNFVAYIKRKETDFLVFRRRYRITGLIAGTFWALYLLKKYSGF